MSRWLPDNAGGSLRSSSWGICTSDFLSQVLPAHDSRTLTFQRLLAVGVALLDFSDTVKVLPSPYSYSILAGISHFCPAAVKNLHNGRVALAKGQVGAVVFLAVFDVQGDDLLVVLANVATGSPPAATKWPMSKLTPM